MMNLIINKVEYSKEKGSEVDHYEEGRNITRTPSPHFFHENLLSSFRKKKR